MRLRVARRQFPVGQGCFHAGSVNLEEKSNKLHYVYDCGSTSLRHLRRQIVRYREHTSSVNALFVSHFHADHVSGLDDLLGTVNVETVYIPYVDNMVLLLDILEADMDGDISGSLIEISFNPASWFGRRGVDRVVRILPGEPNVPELADDVDFDPENDAELRLVESPEPRTKSTARYTRSLGMRAELLTMDPGRIGIWAHGRFTRWALIPYVHPASVPRKRVFTRRLRSALRIRSGDQMTSDILIAALSEPSKRKRLRKCYDEIIGTGSSRLHNRTSLSLYSGPLRPFEGNVESACSSRHGRFPEIYPFYPWLLSEVPSDRVGWIGTGDADLNTNEVRDQWRRAYHSVESDVATLLLPHHGSRRNFHPDLLDFPNLQVCVAAAARPSQYMHPSDETIDAVNQRKKIFVHVSQRFESQFEEHFRIRYSIS